MTRSAIPLLMLVALCRGAHGDGGIVRASEVVGPWHVTVFTSPVPLRAGPADVSVFVQDAGSHDPVLTARVDVIASNRSRERTTCRATREDATNRLMYAALLTFPEQGDWTIDVSVTDGTISDSLTLTIAVGAARPPWTDHLPLVALPLVGLVLFAGHQVLVSRHQSGLRR